MRIWILLSYRAGMNSQILGLAEALDRPYELKRLSYRSGSAGWLPAYLCRVSLAGLDLAASSPLEPPWPDLLVTAGRRHEPVCRWIRERSKGRTRLVFLGRTWAASERFDLVVTTPQYRLEAGPHVLENPTTLHRVTDRRLTRAAERWRSRLGTLPRPRIAVLAGGTSGPYPFGPIAARRLARQAAEMASAEGGSLMVTTSARTSPLAAEALESALTDSAFFYRYAPDDTNNSSPVPLEGNPYFGLLALADGVIVTGDSICMLSEAVATGKPVFIFDLATGRRSMRGDPGDRRDGGPDDFELRSFLYRLRMRLGPRALSRDITLVHRRLAASGKALWLGDPWPKRLPSAGDGVIEATVHRVLELAS